MGRLMGLCGKVGTHVSKARHGAPKESKRKLRSEDFEPFRLLWDAGKASGPAKTLDLNELRGEARTRLKQDETRAAQLSSFQRELG